ncbi:MAG: hypothetical protein WAM89_02355 [Terriglobales bacterium]
MKIPVFSRARLFSGVLLLGLLGMTARNAIDPDLWWHLRAGQWIVETGHVPHVDSFSFTRAGQPWVAHEWLSEVVFYELWKLGGPVALIVFSALVTSAGFMVLFWRCAAQAQWAAAATALGALAAASSWGVRPQMFTFTLAALLLWLLERGESRPGLLLWIPPLFLLWLNLHAGFALGPALLLAYGAGILFETAFGHTPWQQARPIVVRVLLVVAACLALVPLNPNGAKLYRYPFETLSSHGMRSLIAEWGSPDFHRGLYLPLLAVWLLLLVVFASGRARPKWRVFVPLLLTGFAALDAARHIPIFILLAIPVIAAALPAGAGAVTALPRRLVATRFRPIFNLAVIVLTGALVLAKWSSLARNEDAKEAEMFPREAVAFLHSGDYPRDLFVDYDWGGYVLWKLYPEYRVFVDGRADLYGDKLLRQGAETVLDLRTGWREVLDHWKVEAILVPPSSAVAQALMLDPEWHVAFRDSKATVLVRRLDPVENARIFEESGLSGPRAIPEALNQKGPGGRKNVSKSHPNLRN